MTAVNERRREYQREYAQRRRDRLVAMGLTSNGTSRRQRQRDVGWPATLERASAIVRSYPTSVTLRQLFYRLVSDGTLRNTTSDYQTLSSYSATARRERAFPRLIDRTSEVALPATWDSPAEMVEAARRQYRRDRTQGQPVMLWLIVEKAGLLEQLNAWFGELGIPIGALSGYASQTDIDSIVDAVRDDGRPAVLLYGGDFDPTGEDILRDLVERTACWSRVVGVALTDDQVDRYDLPENPGKATDSRAPGFVARHGRLVQVEIDALDPNDLHDLFAAQVDAFWDQSAHAKVLEIEERERQSIRFEASS